jgi:hypothetical protein
MKSEELLGTPPDQITKEEKLSRLQEIHRKMDALGRLKPSNVEESMQRMEAYYKLWREELELHKKYPSVIQEGLTYVET